MSDKKPPPVLEVRFPGAEIRPEAISLVTLSRVFSAVYQLAAGEEEMEEEEGKGDAGSFQLVGVKRGSAAYELSGHSPGVALGRLRIFGRVLENPEDLGESDLPLRPIETLSSVARKYDTQIIIKEPGRNRPILATISPNSYKAITEKLLVSGETQISGEVKGVGGSTDVRCRLRVSFQRNMLYCDVESQETARKIGEFLYKEVSVRGRASWFKNTWRIAAFTIEDVTLLKESNLSKAIVAVRQAGGSDWDKIGDVESYLEEVSGSR